MNEIADGEKERKREMGCGMVQKEERNGGEMKQGMLRRYVEMQWVEKGRLRGTDGRGMMDKEQPPFQRSEGVSKTRSERRRGRERWAL